MSLNYSIKSLCLMLCYLILSWHFLGACSHEEINIPKLNSTNSYAISFDISVAPAQVRATEVGNDVLNENVLSSMDIFFYEGETQKGYYTTESGKVVITKGSSATQGTATIYVPKDDNPNLAGLYQGNNYRMYVLVNYHGSTSLEGKTLSEIKAMAIETTSLSQTYPKKQNDFLMDGMVQTGNMTWTNSDFYHIPGIVRLSRAAAKIRVRIKSIDISVKGVPFTLNGDPQVSLINYTQSTAPFAGSPLSVDAAPVMKTEERSMKRSDFDSDSSWTLSIPFYSYENDWGKNGNRRTHLLIKLNLTGEGKTRDYFYSVPVNYLFATPDMNSEQKIGIAKLLRNHIYDISCNITELGELDPGSATDLGAHIGIEKWNATEPIDGAIANVHYLVVKEKTTEMPNLSVRDIHYLSDLPIDTNVLASSIETSYIGYDTSGSETHGSMPKGHVKVEPVTKDGALFLRVTSPVPQNYVPLYIKFKVQHERVSGETGTPLSEEVSIVQYPPIYVTAEKSIGNPPQTGQKPIYWYSSYGAYSKTDTQDGYQTNNTIYKITVLVPEEGQIVGDPTGGSDKTLRNEASNKVISPEFVIASQWGLSSSVNQYNSSHEKTWNDNIEYDSNGYFTDYYRSSWGTSSRYRDYESAETRAYNYWEHTYGPNGWKDIYGNYYGHDMYTPHRTEFIFKHNGRWRIPTLAELALIVKIQRDKKSAVKSLLWGHYYWSAQTGYAYDFQSAKAVRKGSAFIRAVFDTYNR